jgi:hypothetical protein
MSNKAAMVAAFFTREFLLLKEGLTTFSFFKAIPGLQTYP